MKHTKRHGLIFYTISYIGTRELKKGEKCVSAHISVCAGENDIDTSLDFGWGGTNWYFEYQLVLVQKYCRRVGSGRVALFEW